MHSIIKQVANYAMSELSIKVTIAGRIYPIMAKAEEEEKVRAAAKRVDDNIKLLQEKYAVKDKQDLIAMTALQLATRLQEHDDKPVESVDTGELDAIEKLIDAML